MGLTYQSCGKSILREKFHIQLEDENEFIIALAGNPNVGKSTVFNALTGLNQHTGNWPGKTVTNARGHYIYKDKKFLLMDLPGTYSLLANSVEEQVARDFICFGEPDATIVVADATCLERNLNLLLQIMELTEKVVLCVNLMDEARRKGICIHIEKLEEELGIPVVAATARKGEGLDALMDKVYGLALGLIKPQPKNILYPEEVEKEIDRLSEKLQKVLKNKFNSRWLALRLLEGDPTILEAIGEFVLDHVMEKVEKEEQYLYEY